MKALKPLRIRYGSYVHRVSEAELQISRSPVLNHARRPIAYDERWTWSGRINNTDTTQIAMDRALRAFELAYSVNGRDLVLETFDGVATYHQLLNSQCIGGTKVVDIPQFPSGRGAEGNGYRTYSISVEGRKPILNGESQFISFVESISVRGGGWKTGCREVNYGPGVQQRLRTHSTCFATQQGSATLYFGLPVYPKPIWPNALVDQYPDIDLTTPQVDSDGRAIVLTNRTYSWSYSYEYPLRLAGEPHYLLR